MMSMLEDNTGGTSSVRLIMLLTTAIVLGVWAYACIRGGTMIDIPQGVLTLVLGVSALKVTQRTFGEKA